MTNNNNLPQTPLPEQPQPLPQPQSGYSQAPAYAAQPASPSGQLQGGYTQPHPPQAAYAQTPDHGAPQAPAPKKPLHRLWQFWLILILALVLVIGGGSLFGYLYYQSLHTPMPDLAGVTPYQASQQLSGINSNWDISYITSDGDQVFINRENDYAGWQVVSSVPEPGTILINENSNQILLTIKMTDETRAEREVLIADAAALQESMNNWVSGSTEYIDLGDLAVLVFYRPWNSQEFYTVGVFGEEGSLGEFGQQEHADRLAQSLQSHVLFFYYTNDGYLTHFIFGSYESSPDGVFERAEAFANRLVDPAEEFALENREVWLDVYRANEIAYGGSYLDSVTWEIFGDSIYITWQMTSDYNIEHPNEQARAEWNSGWTSVVRGAAQYLRAYVQVDIKDSSGRVQDSFNADIPSWTDSPSW